MPGAWITANDLEDPTNVDAPEAARAASMLMYQLSGRKYEGIRSITETYEKTHLCSGVDMRRLFDYRRGGGCFNHHRGWLRLRAQPVRSVEAVSVQWTHDELVLAPTEFELVNRTYLRPTRGAQWNVCNNLEVTYTAGTRIPEAGLRAARVLGNELLKARTSPGDCGLPDRVTSISRQGVSYTILDPQDFIKDGRTGLYEVDLFLKTVNPDGARKRSRVYSPDLPRVGRITTS